MEELFHHLLSGKLLLPSLLVVGGVIFVVKRLFVSSLEKATTLRVIKKITNDPLYARNIADELDIPYAVKEGFIRGHFEKLKEYIRGQRVLGDYQVLYTADVSLSEFLVFALLSFKDFDVGITGKGTDVTKNSYVTFLIRHEDQEQRLTLYSNIFTTSTEKFQRAGFMNAVFENSMRLLS